ncbi:hypothetical protein OG455_31820 [Kitasatospora sp. NBC_01287]|uniref:hypothetical protein n=1 Tax=Kitasatospora sp. NBC_01287 TaxID=2903573 RepID=UPI00224FE77F|nr:hypothetical protein [Kitasatospora sp. NBC_01287]MCX4750052.1 hypothetical protein [Kitasatospora sp. NBC_01287]
MKPGKQSAMTLRVYRITPTGKRIRLSTTRVSADAPDTRPFSDLWPHCGCPRCAPSART